MKDLTPKDMRGIDARIASAKYERAYRCARYQVEAWLKQGDDLMAYWRFPTPELVAYIKGIGEAYRHE